MAAARVLVCSQEKQSYLTDLLENLSRLQVRVPEKCEVRVKIEFSKESRQFSAGAETAFLVNSDDSLCKSVVLGSIVGASTIAVGYPFDTLKVRLQTGTKPLFGNLYRGFMSPMCAVIPSYVPLFLSYGAALKVLGSDDPMSIVVAGGVSGICYSFVMCPFEMVKCNTQRFGQPLKDIFRQVVAQRGAAGLYRGLGACLHRDIGQTIAYCTSAEYFTRSTVLQSHFGSATAFVSGMLTGLIHCNVELPFDTVKTRFQTGQYANYRQLLGEMFSGGVASGLRNVYRGYGVWMVRAPIVHGTSFAIVECIHPFLNKWIK